MRPPFRAANRPHTSISPPTRASRSSAAHRLPVRVGQPTGAPVTTHAIEPRAGWAGFDDAKWPVIAPTSLATRRATGRLCFNWYRITVTIPPKIDGFDPTGATVVFETVIDDYAEVWVDGKLPRVLGQPGGALVKGFNAPNRVVLTTDARPGQTFQLAIFGANGPLSDPPSNFIWVRSATLDFFKTGATSGPQTVAHVRRLDPAIASFRRALKLRPKHSLALQSMGSILCFSLGKISRGARFFRAAVESDPRALLPHLNLARLLAERGEPQAAIEFTRALELQPGSAAVQLAYARFLEGQGKNEEAEEHYRRSFDLRPDDPTPAYELARLFAMLGEERRAQSWCERGDRISPTLPRLLADLAQVFLSSPAPLLRRRFTDFRRLS
jgi:tetratricopeptide (TPR) repeat protein